MTKIRDKIGHKSYANIANIAYRYRRLLRHERLAAFSGCSEHNTMHSEHESDSVSVYGNCVARLGIITNFYRTVLCRARYCHGKSRPSVCLSVTLKYGIV